MYYDVGWYGTRMIAWNAMPPDPSTVRRALGGRLARSTSNRTSRTCLAWLRHQADGPYWRQGSVAGSRTGSCARRSSSAAGGTGTPTRRSACSRASRARQGAHRPVGPRAARRAIPGPRIDYLREVVRWLDHWCRGIDTGVMDEPPIASTCRRRATCARTGWTTPGHWRSEAVVAAAPARGERTLHLAARTAHAATRAPSRVGSRFVYDPTVGHDRRAVVGRRPVRAAGRPAAGRGAVRSSTPPSRSTGPLSILGRARAVLHVPSSASVIGFVVSLSDVDPDGASHLVAKGTHNVTRRASLTSPTPLTPDEVVELAIEIDATGWRFLPGHRIRLSIAAADWPNVWPTPEPATSRGVARRRPAVAAGAARGARGGQWPASRSSSRPRSTVRPAGDAPPAPTWTRHRDAADRSGRSARIETASRFRPLEGADIDRDFGMRLRGRSGRPAHAVARGWHRCRTTRDGRLTASRADVTIVSDAERLRVTIDLEVSVDGEVHATRHWDETDPARAAVRNEGGRHGRLPDAPPGRARRPARARLGPDPVRRADRSGRRNAASVIRLEGSGRLLMVFTQTPVRSCATTAAIMQTTSDDDGDDLDRPAPGLRLSRAGSAWPWAGSPASPTTTSSSCSGRIQIDPCSAAPSP